MADDKYLSGIEQEVGGAVYKPRMMMTNIDAHLGCGGMVCISALDEFECVAAALFASRPVAMLVRHRNESLLALIDRLDSAIGAARQSGAPYDEVNT